MRFSTLARPPIQPEEAERAEHSICPYHGGKPAAGWWVPGRVFFCPLGREFWRYTAERTGMYAPLNYPQSGVI